MQIRCGDGFFRERWRFASLAALGWLQVAILFKFDHGLHFGPASFGFAPKGAESFPLTAIFSDFFSIFFRFKFFNFFHAVFGGVLAASGLLIFRAQLYSKPICSALISLGLGFLAGGMRPFPRGWFDESAIP